MCGIAGELNSLKQLQARECYEAMKETLRHRGPDQNGVYEHEMTCLVHTRLAIVDIEKGRQPMIEHEQTGDVVLVYNGELYNSDELREACEKKGYRFKTHSDTEVVLKSYLAFGERCVEMMNGIFAFAIFDERIEALFIARDRFGVKPFFYSHQAASFIFGSEIKSLLAHPKVSRIINRNSLHEIFCIGPGRTPGEAVFRDIKELLPATCGFFKQGNLHTWTYWQLQDRPWIYDEATTVKKVQELVEDAITRQLKCDVPVATFLSGGLDSSIISSIGAKYFRQHKKVLHTFSVEYVDNDQFFKPTFYQPNRDQHYIDIMKEDLQSIHHDILLKNEDVLNALEQALIARDLPAMVDIDSSLLLFCKEIRKQAKVALSGECADEIFGGYPWFQNEQLLRMELFPWSKEIAVRLSFLKPQFHPENGEAFVKEKIDYTKMSAPCINSISSKETDMRKMMKLNIDWFMQTLLERKDRMSMATGLEVRVPFCDYRLVEMCYCIPWSLKNLYGREKGILREAFKDVLPDEIVERKKSPYPKTHHPSYLEIIKKHLQSILDDDQQPIHEFIVKERLQQLIVNQEEIQWYGQLMSTPQTMAYFIQFNFWLKHYNIQFEDCE